MTSQEQWLQEQINSAREEYKAACIVLNDTKRSEVMAHTVAEKKVERTWKKLKKLEDFQKKQQRKYHGKEK